MLMLMYKSLTDTLSLDRTACFFGRRKALVPHWLQAHLSLLCCPDGFGHRTQAVADPP